MALYLVQHGINAAKDTDPERGLTDQGSAETARIAQVAKGYGINVGRIVHSGKKRAAQTASIYHDALSLKTPVEVVPQSTYFLISRLNFDLHFSHKKISGDTDGKGPAHVRYDQGNTGDEQGNKIFLIGLQESVRYPF